MEVAYGTNEHMIKLVNDLLDVSRMESGKMEYVFIETDLDSFVKETVGLFMEIATTKGITLTYIPVKDKIPPIFIDQDKMRTAIQNVIENACEYTLRGGKIDVRISKQARNVVISVADSGIGIRPEHIPRLSNKFFRTEEAVKMCPNGSGLGLFITQGILNRHGGSLRVESKIGKGSDVKLVFPLERELAPQVELAKEAV